MTMLDYATDWFEIVKVPSYTVEKVIDKKAQYEVIIDKFSATISQLFKQTWLTSAERSPHKIKITTMKIL